jgi:hypothetical protein
LLNRDTVLAEFTPPDFAEPHGFRMLGEDNIAVNPALAFRVETFTPTETFKPEKPYLTRLKWRDPDGNDQSKLLLTKPESVIAVIRRGGAESAPVRKGLAQRPSRSRPPRRSSRKLESVRI